MALAALAYWLFFSAECSALMYCRVTSMRISRYLNCCCINKGLGGMTLESPCAYPATWLPIKFWPYIRL